MAPVSRTSRMSRFNPFRSRRLHDRAQAAADRAVAIVATGAAAVPEGDAARTEPLAVVQMPPAANRSGPASISLRPPVTPPAPLSPPSPPFAVPPTAEALPMPALKKAQNPVLAPVADPVADKDADKDAAPAAAAERSAPAGYPGKTSFAPLPAAERYGRGLPNLTDLADRYGSDKGSTKHRYTELYNLLFQPYRDQPIGFLEMGLQIGGPELGQSEDRATTDLPSVRMWLEYFSRAHITGLDVSDFGWFAHERFSFVRCDMDNRANIAAAALTMPPLDIMIDDASHASHHQQNAFLELFPKLNAGGIYIIEDLRWQPAAYEKPGITKTADLFQSYVQTGVFEHKDRRLKAAFNDLRLDISGCFLHQVQFNKTRRDQVAVIHKR